MIYDSFHESSEKETKELSTIWDLLLLAVATSIDALATGVSFSLQNAIVWLNGGISIFFSFTYWRHDIVSFCLWGNPWTLLWDKV